LLSHEETADRLAELYSADFNGKKMGRFRLDRKTLAVLGGRQNIEQLSVTQISLWLAEKHDLLLIDLHDEFAILKCGLLRRYRKATVRVLEDILGISYESSASDEDD